MSQARKIYEYLTQTRDPSADKALLMALRLAEPPYQQTILDSLLDRGRASGTSEIVSSYHRCDSEQKKTLLNRVDNLRATFIAIIAIRTNPNQRFGTC